MHCRSHVVSSHPTGHTRACMCACVHACVRACVHVRARKCVCPCIRWVMGMALMRSCVGWNRYFVPTAADVPKDLRISLLGNSPNARAVHSSKAVRLMGTVLVKCVG